MLSAGGAPCACAEVCWNEVPLQGASGGGGTSSLGFVLLRACFAGCFAMKGGWFGLYRPFEASGLCKAGQMSNAGEFVRRACKIFFDLKLFFFFSLSFRFPLQDSVHSPHHLRGCIDRTSSESEMQGMAQGRPKVHLTPSFLHASVTRSPAPSVSKRGSSPFPSQSSIDSAQGKYSRTRRKHSDNTRLVNDPALSNQGIPRVPRDKRQSTLPFVADWHWKPLA